MVFGLSVGVAMIFFGANQGWLSSRVLVTGRLENVSVEERWTGLKIASEKIISQPLATVGLGNYSNFLINKYPGLSAWQYQPAHNLWLLLTAEAGFWSAICFALVWLLVVLGNKKRRAVAVSLVSALFVLSLFDHWLISLPFGILFCFFVLSLSSDETIL